MKKKPVKTLFESLMRRQSKRFFDPFQQSLRRLAHQEPKFKNRFGEKA